MYIHNVKKTLKSSAKELLIPGPGSALIFVFTMFADLGAHTKDFVGCNSILGTAQARNERSGQQPADEIR